MIFCRKKRRKCPPCLPLNTVTDWSCLPTIQTGSMYALHTCGPSSSEGTESPPDVVDIRPHQCLCSCCLLLLTFVRNGECAPIQTDFYFFLIHVFLLMKKLILYCITNVWQLRICTVFHYDQLSSAIVTWGPKHTLMLYWVVINTIE